MNAECHVVAAIREFIIHHSAFIHYFPGRGTTYNLWGFGCVKLWLGTKVIRVGSDDVENLVAFLRTKVGQSAT